VNIIQITPGAGGMYCGGCFRDNDLVTALRRLGHEALMVPLYLPLTLDEPDQSAGTPIFFGGISVYLDQKLGLFRNAPAWVHSLLSWRPLLQWASGRAAKTRAEDVGEMTLSMIRGEEGLQARELEDLIAWLKTQPKPDAICLSNVLLAGMARRLKGALGTPVVCLLTGEDTFLDSLPESVRALTWNTLAQRCADIDLFLPPSRYFGDLMQRRLHLRPEQLHLVPNGIGLADYDSLESLSNRPLPAVPTLGFFARMCPQKGLDLLVDAYLLLKQRDETRALRLHIGGGCGPGDEPFVAEQRRKLASAGVLTDVQFFPNVDHAQKVAFYQGLSVFSTPAMYGEAFGLYLLEAWAAGVPVVQPCYAAFPELVDSTGAGLLCKPADPVSLADGIAELLREPARARELGLRGSQAVRERFSREHMAQNFVAALNLHPS